MLSEIKWRHIGGHLFFYLIQLPESFLPEASDGRQPEVDFLYHGAVVWFKISGKSSL